MGIKFEILSANLQLFADGGAGASGDAGTAGSTGVNSSVAAAKSGVSQSNPLADVKYGIQDESEAQSPAVQTKEAAEKNDIADRKARYDAFLKENKDLDDQRIQDIVQRRVKGMRETVDKYDALAPVIEMLNSKYGVKDGDIDALTKAINDDDTFFEEEALERGLTVEQLKTVRKMERENAELKRQMQEQRVRENADKLYAKWLNEAEAAKTVYPSFDLESEMSNPKFVELLRSNVDARTAYEVVHKDDIIAGAMQFSAQTVQKKLADSIAAGKARPAENGTNSAAASLTKSDVSQLTKEDRQEIARRVARGEKIRF